MWRVFPTNLRELIDDYEFESANSLDIMLGWGEDVKEVGNYLRMQSPSLVAETDIDYSYLKTRIDLLKGCIQRKNGKEHNFSEAKYTFSNVLGGFIRTGDNHKLWKDFAQ